MTLTTKFIKPSPALSDFVESFWLLQNDSESEKEVVILPDGRVDLFFSKSATESFHVTLLGLETKPSQAVIAPNSLTFAISFKLLGAEYILQEPISDLLDIGKRLADDFWNFNVNDLNDFESFCKKGSIKMQDLLNEKLDERKLKLFDLIYSSNGSITVNELAEKIVWSSRQINRYFNQQFGLSLKAYCNILRFRASFPQIKEGKLFPEQNFADQSHFIKEIKRLSGVSPKELNRNKNDRFIQFLALPKK